MLSTIFSANALQTKFIRSIASTTAIRAIRIHFNMVARMCLRGPGRRGREISSPMLVAVVPY